MRDDVEFCVGRPGRYDRPEWAPIEQVLPERLFERFMWMNTVELHDGTELHAYKHGDSRRYLLLDTDGAAYEDLDRDRFRRMRLADALEQAFGVWWIVYWATAEERELVRQALDAAAKADEASGRDVLPPSSPASPFRRLP